MSTARIKFGREDREGLIAVGTYLIDAASRFGIRFSDKCVADEGLHFCLLEVTEGAEHLSPLTKVETEYFRDSGHQPNERLGCQAMIETAGDLTIMTKEKDADEGKDKTAEEKNAEYKKEFAELPLERKVAQLMELEAIAFGETVSFIINSPGLVFGKVLDVMAEFGLKKDEQTKKASRPAEHDKTSAKKNEAHASDAKPRPSRGSQKAAESK